MAIRWLTLLVGLVAATASMAAARQENPLRHPAVQEVQIMMNGGVAYEVMIERIRRMEDVPALDAQALEALRREDVPDKVLVELVRRKETAKPCTIPARKNDNRDVMSDPAIREVVRRADAGTTTSDLVAYVGQLHFVPVLDGRALDKLTGEGVPDRVLVELVRKQPIPQGCDPAREELMAGVNAEPVKTKQKKKTAKTGSGEAPVHGTQAAPVAPVTPVAVATVAVHGDLAALVGEPHAAVAPMDSAAATAVGTGRVRIVVKSSLPVTYLSIQFDGKPVVRKGELPEAETKPGWTLPPIPIVNIKKGEIVHDVEVPAGPHPVEVEFGLSRIVQTQWDDVVEAYGQRYDTAKVGPLDAYGLKPICQVAGGRTCVVLATLVQKGKVYAVVYEITDRNSH